MKNQTPPTAETTAENWVEIYRAHDFKFSDSNNVFESFEAKITTPGFEHLGVKRVKLHAAKESAANVYSFFLIGSAEDWRDLNASKAAS